nr:PREDICTED: cilia- and flagella-associated protein 54-like [Latimeria chalumnae]|eukprot:XP_014343640.1 PREDICTED: cilia- and flagella-associated protein 54-like [Latimeria chalumnae]
MILGQSDKVLEYLLWAAICMESSIPLLAVHYLTWRATLYSAVCHCYYDCRASLQAEIFARRALSKINELSQLESMSSSPRSIEIERAFKEATIKMAVMVFKRAVYEPRRKPKTLLRPKQKINLKDLQNLSWPRTNTERLLAEMFVGSASQFLAIIEALSDSKRRVLETGPPVPDEPEVNDVLAELFFAGLHILGGGGGNAERSAQGSPYTDILSLIYDSKSLLQFAIAGKNTLYFL